VFGARLCLWLVRMRRAGPGEPFEERVRPERLDAVANLQGEGGAANIEAIDLKDYVDGL
jgi:hypothetical protein